MNEDSSNAVLDGLKPGDFIQTVDHFGDVYFEVTACLTKDGFIVDYITYDKYSDTPRTRWLTGRDKGFVESTVGSALRTPLNQEGPPPAQRAASVGNQTALKRTP